MVYILFQPKSYSSRPEAGFGFVADPKESRGADRTLGPALLSLAQVSQRITEQCSVQALTLGGNLNLPASCCRLGGASLEDLSLARVPTPHTTPPHPPTPHTPAGGAGLGSASAQIPKRLHPRSRVAPYGAMALGGRQVTLWSQPLCFLGPSATAMDY